MKKVDNEAPGKALEALESFLINQDSETELTTIMIADIAVAWFAGVTLQWNLTKGKIRRILFCNQEGNDGMYAKVFDIQGFNPELTKELNSLIAEYVGDSWYK